MSRKLLTRGSTVTAAAAAPSDLEVEYVDLQKKFRMMEGDRKAYSEQAQATIRKQRQQIEKVKKDNEALQEQMDLATRTVASLENVQVAQQLARLADQKGTYEKKIEEEQLRQKELDAQIKALAQKVQEERTRLGGVHASKDLGSAVGKQVKILENRLEKAMVKFNEALTKNRELRELIDNLRRERLMFDNIYKKLELQLNEKKSQMALIIEDSNSSYEARDEAQARIAELKDRSDRETADFDVKMRDLQTQIATDKRNKDFLQLMQGKSQKSSSEEPGRRGRGTELDKARLQTQISAERVQSYEEAFEKIKTATGISDPEEFVTQFIRVEDQNFSLFNYVNELNTEIEKLEEQIAEIRNEIEKYKGEGVTSDSQRKKVLTELEDRLRKTEQKADMYDTKYQEHLRVVSTLKVMIQSLFSKIGCNAAAITEMLGNAGVTEHNMMAYLGIVEQRTNEMLQAFRVAQASDGAGMVSMVGPQTPVGITNIHPGVLPSTGDDVDEEELSDGDDERPLTREELKMRTLRGSDRLDSSMRRGSPKTKLESVRSSKQSVRQ